MIEKCPNCDFYIRENEISCPDCGGKTGRFEPATLQMLNKDFLKKSLTVSFYVYLLLFILTIIFIFVGLTANQKPFEKFIPYFIELLPFWFILSTSVSFLLSIILFNAPKEKELLGLRAKSETIEKRLAEIGKRELEIEDILRDIKSNETKSLQDMETKLLSAKDVLKIHRIKYKLHQKKIKLVRLQNDVSPYLFEFQNLNDEQLDEGLTVIKMTQNNIKTLRHKVHSESNNELSETTEFIDQLTETESSYSKLREAIVRKQATNIIDEVSPIENYLNAENTNEVTHAIETFNANVELSISTESFSEFENEYLTANLKYQLKK